MAEDNLPIDRGWAWFIVLGYFISNFCMVGIAKSFGILLVEFVRHFDISVAMAALVMSISGAVYTFAAPVMVAAGQHFTQRKIVIFGGIVGACGIALSSLLISIEYVILTFGALYGLGNACLFGNGLVMIGMYFKKMRSLANGLALSGSSIGQFAIPPLLQYMLDTYSLRGTLLIIGGMYLHVVICGCLYRPLSMYTEPRKSAKTAEAKTLLDGKVDKKSQQVDNPQNHSVMNIETDEPGVNETTCLQKGDNEEVTKDGKKILIGSVDSLHIMVVNTDNLSDAKMAAKTHNQSKCVRFLIGLIDIRVLDSLIVLLYTAVSFFVFFGYFNFILFMPAAALAKKVTDYEKALLVSITGICDLFGRILIGVAGDFTSISRYKLMGASTILCGLSIFGFIFADVYWLMGVCVGLYGFFGGCYVSMNAPVIIDFVGLPALPKVLGVILFIQGLGAALGQLALGALKDHLGSFEAVNYICSAAMLGGSSLLFLYPLVKRMEEQRSRAAKRSEELEMEVVVPIQT